MKKLLLFLLAAAPGSHSCTPKSSFTGKPVAERIVQNGVEVVSADISAFTNTITLPLSELAGEIEIVRLESSDQALFQYGKVFVSERHIGIATYQPRSFKLFDRSGKYLRDIGHEGRGPGEYGNIYSAAIDEASQTVYILPWGALYLLAFDIDGTLKDPVKLAYTAQKGVFRVNADGTFTFAVIPMWGSSPSWVWTQDRTGKVLSEVATPAGREMNFSSELSAGMNTDAFDPFLEMYNNTENDTLCEFDPATGTMTPVFTVRNIQSKRPPYYSYTQLPRHFIGSYSPGMEDPTVGDGFVNQTALPPVHFIVDKKTLRGAIYSLVIDELGDLGAWPVFSNGYFIDNRAAINLKTDLEKQLEGTTVQDPAMRKRLKELNDSIAEDDNNVLILARLKK